MAKDWLQTLKPGQEIIVSGSRSWDLPTISFVARLTDTQVVLESGKRFRRKDGREVGADSYWSSRLEESTPEQITKVRAQLRRARAEGYLRAVDWSKLPDEAVNAAYQIVKKAAERAEVEASQAQAAKVREGKV